MIDIFNNTVSYYDQNAEEFANATKNVDMAALYTPFLRHIPKNGRILDAGCGSGRDSKNFLDRGYVVEAFDASQKVCALASSHVGMEVVHASFASFCGRLEYYDGIWACASLLHLPIEQLIYAFGKLADMLKPGGALYASFKTAIDETHSGGRYFIPMEQRTLLDLIQSTPSLQVESCWHTSDARPKRKDLWLNALALKSQLGRV